ncbi:MAG: hypothetical protein AAGG51_08985 [Cyanobacteria bacterium P01_G01_bin.54]
MTLLPDIAALDPTAIANTDTNTLKTWILEQAEAQDTLPMGQKVKRAKVQLMPLFAELERRNPTPALEQQVPLIQGIWRSVWSTIPFQDMLPGRLRTQSYQIFAANGYYANLARYKPGHKQPLLNGLTRWLLSYDLMIIQTYQIQGQYQAETNPQRWAIQNVGIRQVLRWGPRPLDAVAAQNWFEQAVERLQADPDAQPAIVMSERRRSTAKKYQNVLKSQPVLEHLYMDADFRLVKSRRDAAQRPSYTIAVRLP